MSIANKSQMPNHKISDFNYELPEAKIAKFPLQNRSDSKLLVFKNGEIQDAVFKDLDKFLPKNTLLVFNNTKVIPARFRFKKNTGASIEIFLISQFNQQPHQWECIVGNKAKFKLQETIQNTVDPNLTASWKNREKNIISFSHPQSVHKALMAVGEMPLPPYLNRKPNEADKTRYQTVFAKVEGAVAAPTASLHFNKTLVDKLKKSGVSTAYCTLHVGLGTFAPVKKDNTNEHHMHSEYWQVDRPFIQQVFQEGKKVVPVGTTSMRVLESLCIVAQNIKNNVENPCLIIQGQGYSKDFQDLKPIEAKAILIQYMDKMGLNMLSGTTSLFITPSFHIKLSHAIITNFHQPKSTLLLLIAALVGNHWKRIYEHAMLHNYRFLSYGDGSYLQISKQS